MIYKIAQFQVQQDKLEACLQAIAEFVKAVSSEPDTLVYQSFQLPDQVSFMHLMAFKDSEAEAFHRATLHVQKFVSVLYPNCSVKPVFTDLALVGSSK